MDNILFECQACNILSSQSGFCINGHTLTPVHYVKKEDHLIEVTRLSARLDTNRAQVEALIAERDKAVSELGERRENFTVMLNRLLEAEQNHSKTRAQLSYVLADNAQLRAVLVHFLEWANAAGMTKDFSEIIEKLQTGLNIMGDPRENHD